MKIAILGDVHLGVRGDLSLFHDFFEKFYTNIFFPYLKEHNIKSMIQLGDLFDRRKYISFQSLDRAKKYFFDPLEQNQITSYFIVGNHDIALKHSLEINSPRLLLKEYNFNIIDTPQEINFDGLNTLLLPWICDENKEEIFNTINNTRSQICFGHLELQGFEMNKGIIVNDVGFDRKLFENFEHVYSGHYHHRSTAENITYVGTPCEHTWADYNDQKGFHIFDTDTREAEYIPNPYTIFNKIHYDNGYTGDLEKYKNTYVKVVVINKDNPFTFDSFIDKLEKIGLYELQIVEDALALNLENEDDLVQEAEDTLSIIKKMINQVETDVDKDDLFNLFKQLHTEAVSDKI